MVDFFGGVVPSLPVLKYGCFEGGGVVLLRHRGKPKQAVSFGCCGDSILTHTHPQKAKPRHDFLGLETNPFYIWVFKKKTPDINPTNKTKNVYPEDPNTKDRRRGIFGEGEL